MKSETEHLVNMANQIALNAGAGLEEAAAAARVAEHIQRFWSPRMREKLGEKVRSGSEGLSPVARLAMNQVLGGY